MHAKRAGHRVSRTLAQAASTKERQTMLRVLSLAVLTAFAVPSHATEVSHDDTVIAQQQQAPQQTPKRDCERKRDEGVS
jgi:hypothetical protein